MSDHYLIEPDKRLMARLHAACQVRPTDSRSVFDWREQPLIGDAGVVARAADHAKRPEEA